MPFTHSFVRIVIGFLLSGAVVLPVRAAEWDHVHILAPDTLAAAQWYATNFKGELIKSGPFDAVMLGPDLVKFRKSTAETKRSNGTAIQRIGITTRNLNATITRLYQNGTIIDGQATEVKNGPLWAYLKDPWGTFIYVINGEAVGLHHVRLLSHDPEASRSWYSEIFGGEPDTLNLGGADVALRYGQVLLVFGKSENEFIPSVGNAIDHIGFKFTDFDEALKRMQEKNIEFLQAPQPPDKPAMAYIVSPDGAKIETVRAAGH